MSNVSSFVNQVARKYSDENEKNTKTIARRGI